LSRALFGFTKEDIDYALSYSMDEYIDNHLLRELPEPQSPGFWVNDVSSSNSTERSRELVYWWINLMLTQKHSLTEKMVLFWHNHFVSELSVVKLPQRMYRQNKLFRKFAFGNFRDLTKEITVDPAMLIYLDNTKNRKEDPNENYARELLELFTLGIGNYTENDIVEAARALTGWEVEGLEAQFNPERFDDGIKNFMNQSGNFNYSDLIDIIFNRDETALHICRKLFKEFIYFEPDEEIINQLAVILRENDYDLKPLISELFKSEFFHSDEIVGSKIKSPVEFIVQTLKQFNVLQPNYEDIRKLSDDIGQALFSPPNVAGWEGDKTWINTNTLPARNVFTDKIIDSKNIYFDILEYARSFSTSENALQFIDELANIFLSYELSANRKQYLLDALLDGAEIYDWSTYNENSKARLESLFKALCRLAEYQLT
jgi:uncharacterized protein (DUF1800 family)